MQDKKKTKTVSAIYNQSSITLTKPMESLLNRGLNFCVTPHNINRTEILVDYRKFERSMKWREFFSDQEKEDQNNPKPEMFKTEKTNLPPKSSQTLQNFLTGIKSEMMGTAPNKSRPNISVSESEALKSLINLQKTCQIVIKPCDKGAGIFICNFKDYIKHCEDHLTSTTENGQRYYKEIAISELDDAKQKIATTLKKALEKDEITRSEYNAMSPLEKGPAKYILRKKKQSNSKATLPYLAMF
jgi:hypothetical protein